MRMIIANRLKDGLVVFLTASGSWSVDIADGVLLADESEVERYLEMARKDEQDCIVIDPTLIEVTLVGDVPKPVAMREAIRAFGPTV